MRFAFALYCCACASAALARSLALSLDTQANHRYIEEYKWEPLRTDVVGTVSDKGLRLVEYASPAGPINSRWMPLDEVLALIRRRTHFLDVTDSDQNIINAIKEYKLTKPLLNNAPSSEQQQPKQHQQEQQQLQPKLPYNNYYHPLDRDLKLIETKLLSNASTSFLARWIDSFTSLSTNRYEHSFGGYLASKWVYDECVRLVKHASLHHSPLLSVTVGKFKHQGYQQFSVLVRIQRTVSAPLSNSSKNRASDSAIVFSANLDAFNLYNPMTGPAPGANENASGSATLFEVLRILLTTSNSTITSLNRPIEFHWYAASTSGRIGSQQVASQYNREGVKIGAVFHIARTGWDPSSSSRTNSNSGGNLEKRVAIASDSDPSLAKLLKRVVGDPEVGFIAVDRICGFGCADHWSWQVLGYPTGYLMEAAEDLESPFSYQLSDALSTVSFPRVKKYVNIVVKLVVQLCM
ncbi:hypothetical protein BDR26DRAFT_882026 [Obelidium mucronatum]|nr:hypothetical protein BDR26DRAFT_882026 [Obelidium mucronatum]